MNYQILPFSPQREVVIDSGFMAARRHIVYGLLEADVTLARAVLKASKAGPGGKGLSFTAYMAACLGRAIARDPRVQAYRDWRGRLVVFQDVDVVMLVEPEPGGVAIPHIIREANRKSVGEISAEIRAVQAKPESSPQRAPMMSIATRLPRFTRMLFWWALKKNPWQLKRLSGTTVITSVGMFGRGGGWGIAFLPVHTLGLAIGGIATKPGEHEGQIALCQFVSLTLSFDHDIVDGAPAARFARRLCETIEGATVLKDEG